MTRRAKRQILASFFYNFGREICYVLAVNKNKLCFSAAPIINIIRTYNNIFNLYGNVYFARSKFYYTVFVANKHSSSSNLAFTLLLIFILFSFHFEFYLILFCYVCFISSGRLFSFPFHIPLSLVLFLSTCCTQFRLL